MLEKINELIKNKDFVKLKKQILDLNEVDIAQIIETIEDNGERIKVFRLLPKDIAADVFPNLDLDIQQEIIVSLLAKEAADILDNLYSDDAVDLLEEMPANVVTKLLANTNKETRMGINFLLKYPVNSAGSIMNIDFLELKEHLTVEGAIEKIRKDGREKEIIDVCFLVDKSRKLLGTVQLKDLLFNDPHISINSIMDDKLIYAYTYDDQEEVASRFSKYDLTAMPVVDTEKRLVGIITIDDVVDILQQEATEDIEKMAAISPSDKPYMKTGVLETWKKRIPWLLLLMISATFTGQIIKNYEAALASYVVLTAFIPMFMDTGGNAGGQASVTIIRGISLNEIQLKDVFKVMWKEFRVAILTGLTLASANFLKLMYIDRVDMAIAFIVCSTLMITILIAKTVGCTLPMVAKKIGFDPAVMASPFITTIVDAISLFAYFNIAKLILGI
jgi:magnesium transporter